MHGPSDPAPHIDNLALSIYAIEVLARLNETIDTVETAYRQYEFSSVAQRLYDFFWSDYCDWFVEASKSDIFSDDESRKKSALAVMDVVLSSVLRLLHPFMPFVTEELWSLLGFGKDSVQSAAPPQAIELDSEIANKGTLVSAIYKTVQAGRNLRADTKLPSNKKARFVLRTPNESLRDELPTIARLLNADEVALDRNYEAQPGVPVAATALGELFLIIADTDKSAERERLDKEIAKIESEVQTVKGKLSNAAFIEKAPANVVEEHRRRETDFIEQLSQLCRARAALD
jgi:valyl-tRNA synthetase